MSAIFMRIKNKINKSSMYAPENYNSHSSHFWSTQLPSLEATDVEKFHKVKILGVFHFSIKVSSNFIKEKIDSRILKNVNLNFLLKS